MCQYVKVPIEDLIECREILKKHDVYLASKLWLLEQVCNREGWKGLKEGEIEVTGPKLAKAMGCDRRYANRMLDKFILEFDMLRNVDRDTLEPSNGGRMAKLVGSKIMPPSRPHPRPQEKPQEKPHSFPHNKGEVEIQTPSETPSKTPSQTPSQAPTIGVSANGGAGLEGPQEYKNINKYVQEESPKGDGTENVNEKMDAMQKDGPGLFDGCEMGGIVQEEQSLQEKEQRTDPPVRTKPAKARKPISTKSRTPREMLDTISKEHRDLLRSLVEAWTKKGGKGKAINFRTIVMKWVQICEDEPDITVLFNKMKPMVDEMKKRDPEYIQELSRFLEERSWEMYAPTGDKS